MVSRRIEDLPDYFKLQKGFPQFFIIPRLLFLTGAGNKRRMKNPSMMYKIG
jgi:hypothetical protein